MKQNHIIRQYQYQYQQADLDTNELTLSEMLDRYKDH